MLGAIIYFKLIDCKLDLRSWIIKDNNFNTEFDTKSSMQRLGAVLVECDSLICLN